MPIFKHTGVKLSRDSPRAVLECGLTKELDGIDSLSSRRLVAMIFAAFAYLVSLLMLATAFLITRWPSLWPVSALLVYFASMGLFVGSLYLYASVTRRNPGWLFKRGNGRSRQLVRFCAWPYVLLERRVWKLWRWRGREAIYEPVRPGLYIGSRLTQQEVASLRRDGVCCVLDMVAEFAAPRALSESSDFSYRCIPVLDGAAPTFAELQQGVEFLCLSLGRGEKAIVHCTFGHGRSALVAAACLLRLGDASTAQQALALLQRCHRSIAPTPEQKRLLERFAQTQQ